MGFLIKKVVLTIYFILKFGFSRESFRGEHVLEISSNQSASIRLSSSLVHQSIFVVSDLHPLCDISRSTGVSRKYSEWSCENVSFACSWRGVTCNDQKSVTEIILEGPVSGYGTVPSSIGLLTDLSHLDIHSFSLGSSISPTVSSLQKLTTLFLHNQMLTSSIPTALCHLSKLEQIKFRTNHLTSSIPTCIGTMKKLLSIDLSINSLTNSIPTTIGSLSNLSVISIQTNKFNSTVPKELALLSNLMHFWIGSNDFSSSIPTFLWDFTKMTLLDLSQNKFITSISTKIGNFKNLARFRIDSNSLTNSIPSSLGLCTKLSYLRVSGNSFVSTIPSSLGNLALLTYFHLGDNCLTGTIPKEVANARSVRRLFFYINSLTGSLPSEFGSFSSLQYMDITNNNLGSSIPSTLCQLTKLQHIGFDHNEFTSTIPSCIGEMQLLTKVLLGSNSLVGSIPSSLGLVTKTLVLIDLSNNRLTCTLPSSLGRLSVLNSLNFHNNLLEGTIPIMFSKLSKLFYLDLSSNYLSSTLPSQLARITGLKTLYLQDNLFTGIVPTVICSLSSLFQMKLAANNLSCSPRCRTDLDWPNSYESGIYRCLDHQDKALYYLNNALNVAEELGKVVITSTLVIESSHPFDEIPSKTLVSVANAFEYSVDMNPTASFCSFDLINFCMDVNCLNIVATYYFSSILNVFGGSKFPISLYNDFYVVVKTDVNNCPPGVFDGYGVTIIARSYSGDSWKFNSTPYLPGPSVEPYALGVCQKPWTGIKCHQGTVTAISLKGYGLLGTIPSSISMFKSLTSLDLSFNDITGSVRSSIGKMPNLDTLILSNNKLKGHIPSSVYGPELFLASFTFNNFNGALPVIPTNNTELKFLFLDGNSFSGEVPSGLCETMLANNRTVTMTNNPKLNCYQRDCWESANFLLKNFDSRLYMCTPTMLPTIIPTQIPTFKPTVRSENVLSNRVGIAIAIVSTLIIIFIASVTIYRHVLSAKALKRRERSARLNQLPVHKYLRQGGYRGGGSLVSFVSQNKDSALEKDYDGMTAIDIILKGEHIVQISADAVCALLVDILPVDIYSGHTVDPSIHNYAWARAVQQNDDIIVEAVSMVIETCPSIVKELANSLDSNGRICKDIASSGCKHAILKKLYLFEKYEIRDGPAEHKSATSLVLFATEHLFDENKTTRQVALKFVRQRDHYSREIETRRLGLDEKYVLPVLTSYDGDCHFPRNKLFRQDSIAKGFEEYPYCLIMDAANMNLKRFIDQQHIAGKEWNEIRQMTRQLACCLNHMHEKGIVHSDIKPLNILLVHSVLKIIDLDGACNVERQEFSGAKYSSAFLPPEMVWIKTDGRTAGIKSISGSEDNNYDCLKASPDQDMWALGCVLYLLCTGAILFQATVEDNIFQNEDLVALCEWTMTTKESRLKAVSDRFAKNLLSLLLNKDPKKRPSAARVLTHPFITGREPRRLQGEQAQWDVFLSYRTGADDRIAEILHEILVGKGLTVWLDKVNMVPGSVWEEAFCSAMTGSACVVCLLSRAGMKNDNDFAKNLEYLRADSNSDSLLLEWRLALELKERGMLEGIFPIMVGDLDVDVYTNYFRSNCNPSPPDVVVEAMEMRLRYHLDNEGLGFPYKDRESVKSVYEGILGNQGAFVEGPQYLVLNDIACLIYGIVRAKKSNQNKYKSTFDSMGDNQAKLTQLSIQGTLLKKFQDEIFKLKNEVKAISTSKETEISEKNQELLEKDQKIAELQNLVENLTYGICTSSESKYLI